MVYNPEDFHVGQRVRIKEWDDMKEEFEVWGSTIQCLYGFTEDMRYLCSTEIVISEIQNEPDSDTADRVFFEDWPDKVLRYDAVRSHPNNWSFSTHMIEPVEDIIGIEFDSVAFNAMLGI